MASKAEKQKRKKLVELILAAQNPPMTYEDWLYNQHKAFIDQKEDVIFAALENQERGNH
ncbi:hypothetical protein KNP65_03805 [Latilactobacillus curvatus]|uniref:hypothetical protein n=1 Tax=Latilactobacillus curvatus TaxID=28038 RepID=UPI0024117A7C|nr:hypothetical protein [Latilactobacillus curvatus]MDG2979063.1 hypothetical protein [Latilactobacillus curvatus]